MGVNDEIETPEVQRARGAHGGRPTGSVGHIDAGEDAGAPADAATAGEARAIGPVPVGGSLSRKLLLVTLAAVMVVEVFVFVPSVANFRRNWLNDRLVAAQIASVASELAEDGTLPMSLRDELLDSAQVKSIAFRRADQRRLIIRDDMPPDVHAFVDLTAASRWGLVTDALAVFVAPEGRMIAVRGNPGFSHADLIEIVLPEAPLRKAMVDYGLNILGLSIIISLFAAVLVYLALNALFVRPMRAMMQNMIRFSQDPEDASRIIVPSGRRDEIGRAEHELARMQSQLRQSLKNKARLASLGLAVSKINHDLRNMLASAQLISDQLETIEHPTVRRFAPKLMNSIDRAIRLCTDTLHYGRAEELPPQPVRFLLRDLVAEVGEALGLPRAREIEFDMRVAAGFAVKADRDQLYRVLSNLCRNALQALDQRREEGGGRAPVLNGGERNASAAPADMITVRAVRDERGVVIEVADTGPGVPPAARKVLFRAFHGSGKRGGTGLGLAISAELVRAAGGSIELLPAGGEGLTGPGATFRIVLPHA
ncbi:MAG: HAMP domain-containing protein [Rhizobiales bacterium]|nr:HAMP domain-containing protein [Hyphomicrobiales bacterium]